MLMRPRPSLVRLPTPKASGDDLLGRTEHKDADDMRGERWDARRVTQSRAYYRLRSFKIGADILIGMIIIILWPTWSLTADSFSNQCLE
jgi:hypothetical protein